MLRNITGLVTTMLGLVALYLVLTRAAGAAEILGALGRTGERIFRTLQGRD